MERDRLDYPRPASGAEITAALDEMDLLPEHAGATIYEPNPDQEPAYTGWQAFIGEAETGDRGFLTVMFDTREALEAALRVAGITQVEEDW